MALGFVGSRVLDGAGIIAGVPRVLPVNAFIAAPLLLASDLAILFSALAHAVPSSDPS